MDWEEKEQEKEHDAEFEAFLRQFRPGRPKALPAARRTVVALAAAAVLLLAIVIPMRFWPGPAASDAAPRVDATVSFAFSRTSTDAGRNTRAAGGLPTLAPIEGLQRPGPSSAPASANAGGATQQRLRVGGAVKAPRRLVNVNPVYPEEAQAAGISGVVILECVIGVDGSVIEARVLQSIPELDQAAIDAVSQWQYETTLLNGEPVEVEMTVTINFTLR